MELRKPIEDSESLYKHFNSELTRAINNFSLVKTILRGVRNLRKLLLPILKQISQLTLINPPRWIRHSEKPK